jgi:hypothetical protein
MHLLPGEVLGTSRLVLNTIISNQRRRRNDLNTAIFILAFVALMVEPVDDLPGILEIDDEGAGLLPAAVGDDTESLPRGTSVASKEYCMQLLGSPDLLFITLFRMGKAVFFDLCWWLHTNAGVKGNWQQTIEQKVMVFLWICAYGEPQRNAALRF